MKVTIEFNLPDEQIEYEMHQNTNKYFNVIWEWKQYMRNRLKYNEEHLTENQYLLLAELADAFNEMINDHGCSNDF
jgi:hypothetical protein